MLNKALGGIIVVASARIAMCCHNGEQAMAFNGKTKGLKLHH